MSRTSTSKSSSFSPSEGEKAWSLDILVCCSNRGRRPTIVFRMGDGDSNAFPPRDSGEDLLHELSMHIGQSELAALVGVRQTFVIEPEEVKHRRLQIVNVNGILNDVKAEFVSLANDDAGFNPAAGHPHRERLRMVIPAKLPTQGQVGLHHRGSAKFTAPDEIGRAHV